MSCSVDCLCEQSRGTWDWRMMSHRPPRNGGLRCIGFSSDGVGGRVDVTTHPRA